jgi:hypothetical protein
VQTIEDSPSAHWDAWSNEDTEPIEQQADEVQDDEFNNPHSAFKILEQAAVAAEVPASEPELEEEFELVEVEAYHTVELGTVQWADNLHERLAIVTQGYTDDDYKCIGPGGILLDMSGTLTQSMFPITCVTIVSQEEQQG